MIEYEVNDQARRDIQLRSFFKAEFLIVVLLSIPVFYQFGFFWGGMFLAGITIFNVLSLVYSYFKKESYKVTIDDKGITLFQSNKQKTVLFSDIKGRYPSKSSRNIFVLRIDPHKFMAYPAFVFMAPDQYVHQIEALLPPQNEMGRIPTATEKSRKLYSILSIVAIATIGILYLGQFVIKNNIHIGEQNWVEHSSTRGNFKITFPREPQEKVYEVNNKDILFYTVTFDGWGDADEHFITVFTEYPNSPTSSELDTPKVDKFLDSAKEAILKSGKNKLISSTYSTFKGIRSIDFKVSYTDPETSKKYFALYKTFYSGRILYTLLNVEPKDAFPNYEKFTSSFNFL